MSSDAGPRSPAAPEDRDQVDFTWLSTFFRKLSGRLYQQPRAEARGAEAAEAAAVQATPDAPPAPDAPLGPPPPEPLPPTPPPPPPETAAQQAEPQPSLGTFLRRVRASARYQRFQRTYGIPLILALVVGVVAMNNHFLGIDWGDDFALYMHQAEALTIGNIGEVLQETRFSVDNSGWHSFSPYAYPWGWPLIVAPFYALFGLDYELFKGLEVLALCTFLFIFYVLIRPRTGRLPATVITLLIGFSPMYVGGTDTVLSDLPYLAFVGLSLWWIDRCRVKGLLTCERRDLIILGLLLAFTFNIRREGLALFVALAALHVAVLVGVVVRNRSKEALRTVDWRRVALPYVTIVGAIAAFQILLPTVLFPDLPGTGWQNASSHLTYYKSAIAEHVGLKAAGGEMQLFGSEVLAERAVFLLVLFASLGLVARLLLRFEEDVALAAYLCAAGFIMLVSPYQDGRYLYTITPLVAYFAYHSVPSVAALAQWRHPTVRQLSAVVPGVALAGLAFLNAQDLAHSTRYHRDYQYVINGPETPSAQEMFAAVREVTRGDDVLLFFRARAMSLYTDRLALQGSDLDRMLKRVDWYVMEKNSTYSQTPLTDAEAAGRGLKKAWENSGWVIWKVPPAQL